MQVYQFTVWPENLAGIKLGRLDLKGCELHLADLEIEADIGPAGSGAMG